MAKTVIPNGPNGMNDTLMAEGGTITLYNLAYGWITSSATELHIWFQPGKSLLSINDISNITITACTLDGRLRNGGYVGGGSNFDVLSHAKSVVPLNRGRQLELNFTRKDNDGTWGTNNTYFVGGCNVTVTWS